MSVVKPITRLLAVVVASSLVAIAGCSAGPDGQSRRDPLRVSEGRNELCVEPDGGRLLVSGQEVLVNDGGRRTVLDAVGLVDADGLSVRRAYVLPIRPGVALVGSAPGPLEKVYPAGTLPGVPNAVGATVEPGASANLLLELERDSDSPASASRVWVRYRSAGQMYEWHSTTRILVGDCLPD